MSLWKRTQQSFGNFKQASNKKPAPISQSDPHSQQFDCKGIKTSKQLVNYLLALQKQKFDKTILEQLKYVTLQANAKRLMQEYEIEQLVRATKIAADVSQHPFSFKVVEKCLPKE